MKTKVPAALKRTEAYADNPEEAQRLWDDGFRPMEARDMKVGMKVAYVDTDPLMGNRSSEVRFSTIESIEPIHGKHSIEPWGYRVEHTGAPRGCPAEVDDGTEVWAK